MMMSFILKCYDYLLYNKIGSTLGSIKRSFLSFLFLRLEFWYLNSLHKLIPMSFPNGRIL